MRCGRAGRARRADGFGLTLASSASVRAQDCRHLAPPPHCRHLAPPPHLQLLRRQRLVRPPARPLPGLDACRPKGGLFKVVILWLAAHPAHPARLWPSSETGVDGACRGGSGGGVSVAKRESANQGCAASGGGKQPWSAGRALTGEWRSVCGSDREPRVPGLLRVKRM